MNEKARHLSASFSTWRKMYELMDRVLGPTPEAAFAPISTSCLGVRRQIWTEKPKAMFSRTVKTADWQYSPRRLQRPRGPVAEEVHAAMKQQPGGDLEAVGGANIAAVSAEAGARCDEYSDLFVHPVAIGTRRAQVGLETDGRGRAFDIWASLETLIRHSPAGVDLAPALTRSSTRSSAGPSGHVCLPINWPIDILSRTIPCPNPSPSPPSKTPPCATCRRRPTSTRSRRGGSRSSGARGGSACSCAPSRSFRWRSARRSGREGNELKNRLEAAHDARKAELEQARLTHVIESERLDVTLPGRRCRAAACTRSRRRMRDMLAAFGAMGFQVAEGPEVELDYYNFEALRIPEDHPARDMQDTFWLDHEQDGRALDAAAHPHVAEPDARSWRSTSRRSASPCPARATATRRRTPRTSGCSQVELLAVDEGISHEPT